MSPDTQHFCLRWNNYQSSITSAFESLRDQDDFVDVTLACDGRSLKAHRVVLSACSSYFRELLKSTPCKHPVIVLQDVSFADLSSLVEFIYHGEVNVHQKNLTSFLKTAEVLRVSGLTQQAERDEQISSSRDRIQGPSSPNEDSSTWNPNRDSPCSQISVNNPATVNQLLKAAALAANRHSKSRRKSVEISDDSRTTPPKKTRLDESPPTAHNNRETSENSNGQENCRDRSITPEQDVPADLSSSSVKANTRSRSQSPIGTQRYNNDVKSEPLELLCNNRDSSTNNENSVDSTGSRDKDSDNEDSIGLHGVHDLMRERVPHYLNPNKLFQTTSPFNFNIAAFNADQFTGLGPVLPRNSDGIAGTSAQGPVSLLKKVFTCGLCTKVLCSKASLKRHVADKHSARQEEYRCHICDRVYCSRNSLMTHIYTYHKTRPGDVDIPPPSSGGINEPQECPFCKRNFSCYYSLKRHFQDKHERSDTLYVCEFCQRKYRTKNSLTTHKSLQHRGTAGMLKRLLKTSSIIGQQQQQQQQHQQQQQQQQQQQRQP
ncbi:zinc finger protein and BTB domain-containing protein, putative [Pediculus humanus corporis]|uniref:Zinc finger protein and BTB domain-containing protein, putative n=1 Tax=Pediculus humanus subsp. corporis TaxID=121224 RepID=E0VK87_PEDHC|nr:zinc finger protein and BTB domain-containing protein, putative [Pediculus humanus corporis]EEB13793.1 zinc finger protein and BTB domain-containing protein, putative [Pediculus humanus corporis]